MVAGRGVKAAYYSLEVGALGLGLVVSEFAVRKYRS
jgi:hypothetical protein